MGAEALLVQYYGACSNAQRGIARRREIFIEVPPEGEPSDPPRPDSPWLVARRKSWARLIRRVYEVDPHLCRCGERMCIVGFITQAPVVRKILHHFGRHFDPLKLLGRSPQLLDHSCHDPFPDYGPQYPLRRPDLLHLPLPSQHTTCASVSVDSNPMLGRLTAKDCREAAAGGVATSVMSGRPIRPTKHNARPEESVLLTRQRKKKLPTEMKQ